MTQQNAKVPPLNPTSVAVVESFGASIQELSPMGAVVEGMDLAASQPPPAPVVEALEQVMAERGFVVFRSDKALAAQDFLQASCWWGGKALHSTHSVHPATPGGNQHLFRLSNDTSQGILGVGPQWHNDGSFNLDTFSHAGYHMVRRAEHGGGTYFAHQAAAFDALTPQQQAYWQRLSSVNATSGVVHPLVHQHPITKRKSIWLHLGMTGAVIEKAADVDAFCLLDAAELRQLCREYNDILNAGFSNSYAIAFEYEENDCLFIDNLSVAHRAAPQAHMPPEQQGLRIMHRSTVKGVPELKPDFGLPAQLNIYGPSPLGEGVWQPGGLGFRWDDDIAMRN